jgi:hypothetical protein
VVLNFISALLLMLYISVFMSVENLRPRLFVTNLVLSIVYMVGNLIMTLGLWTLNRLEVRAAPSPYCHANDIADACIANDIADACIANDIILPQRQVSELQLPPLKTKSTPNSSALHMKQVSAKNLLVDLAALEDAADTYALDGLENPLAQCAAEADR